MASADPRAQAAAAAAGAAHADIRPGGLPADAFRPDRPEGAHAARVCARAVALSSVRATRWDAEGASRIDIEVQSSRLWKRWVRTLAGEDVWRLAVWRGGAIHTPTRRWGLRGPDVAHRHACAACGFPYASARHFWAECPRFDADRAALQRDFRIPVCWWRQQPRCTAKSGWITAGAAATLERRAEMQVAACSLGLRILAAGVVAGPEPEPPPA